MSLTWDVASGLGCTFSNGNKTVKIDNNAYAQGGARGNIGKTTGKWYYEFVLNIDDPSSPGLPAIGISDQTAPSFPGNPGKGVGFYNNAATYNNVEGGAWGSTGSPVTWPTTAIYVSQGLRYGVKINLDDGWVDIISLSAPEGTHTQPSSVGHDAPKLITPGGSTWYPMAGVQFGGGGDHSFTVTIYGDEADFALPRDSEFLPLGLAAPVAGASPSTSSGSVPLEVEFTSTSTGATSYLWDFGDSTTSTDASPTHTYTDPGVYTYSLTVTNAVGSDSTTGTVTVTPPPLHEATVNDWRVQDARFAAVSSTFITAISSAHTRRVVLADASKDVNLWRDSGVLDGAPGAVLYGSELRVICDDGYLRKLNTTTAALISEVDVKAGTTAWLETDGTHYLAPGPKGCIQSVTGTTLTDTATNVVPGGIAAAVFAGGYLYCFGDTGRGAVVLVNSDGTLQKVSEFAATGCRDIRRAKLMSDDGHIVVVCRNRLVDVDISDPTAPVVTPGTRSAAEIFSVLDDADHTPVTDHAEALSSQARTITLGPGPTVHVVTTL